MGGRQWYSLFCLFPTGRTTEALWHMERVLEEDPLSQMWHNTLSYVLSGMGPDTEAVAACRKAVELDPRFWFGYVSLGLQLAKLGQHAEARECANRAFAGAPWSPYSISLLAGTMMNSGETKEAEALLTGLHDSFKEAPGLTLFHLVRGELDKAAEWAGRAVDQRFTGIIVITIRSFEPMLRQSAAWPGLLEKMKLG